jgi:hypothetical protein
VTTSLGPRKTTTSSKTATRSPPRSATALANIVRLALRGGDLVAVFELVVVLRGPSEVVTTDLDVVVGDISQSSRGTSEGDIAMHEVKIAPAPRQLAEQHPPGTEWRMRNVCHANEMQGKCVGKWRREYD